MQNVTRLMEKNAEAAMEDMILEQIQKNNMTISHLREVTEKVIQYMESNAILEMGDPNIAESPIDGINKIGICTGHRPEQLSTSDQHQ